MRSLAGMAHLLRWAQLILIFNTNVSIFSSVPACLMPCVGEWRTDSHNCWHLIVFEWKVVFFSWLLTDNQISRYLYLILSLLAYFHWTRGGLPSGQSKKEMKRRKRSHPCMPQRRGVRLATGRPLHTTNWQGWLRHQEAWRQWERLWTAAWCWSSV